MAQPMRRPGIITFCTLNPDPRMAAKGVAHQEVIQ